jgi:hypothetical protein
MSGEQELHMDILHQYVLGSEVEPLLIVYLGAIHGTVGVRQLGRIRDCRQLVSLLFNYSFQC